MADSLNASYLIEFPEKTLTVTTKELLVYLLEKLLEAAVSHLHRNFSKVVIAIPATLNQQERLAVIDAAKDVGLQTVRLISQPLAAAISFGKYGFCTYYRGVNYIERLTTQNLFNHFLSLLFFSRISIKYERGKDFGV